MFLFLHLQLNTGQATGPAGVDINIAPVWKKNITGNGVVIAVCDDGMNILQYFQVSVKVFVLIHKPLP